MDELLEKLPTLLRENLLAVAIGLIGVVLLIYGLISYTTVKDTTQAVTFSAGDEPSTKDEDQSALIVIDVAGAVMRPGVYKVKEGARFQDAIIAAGGMSEEADQALIAKQINLAAKLSDGLKVYIPFKGEAVAASTEGGGGNISGMININSASATELDTLPGVGAVTSEKIISGRPYGTVEELLKRKIVGQKVFEQIKEKIAVF